MRKTMIIAGAVALLSVGSPALAQQDPWLCQQFRQQGLDCNGMPLDPLVYQAPSPVSPERWTRVGPNTYRNLDATGPNGGQRVIIVPQPQPMRRIH